MFLGGHAKGLKALKLKNCAVANNSNIYWADFFRGVHEIKPSV